MRRPPQGKKAFVCLCEDVTEKDLFDAVAEGFSNIETLKRYSTVCMGPCQGKMCQSGSIDACARANGKTVAETGRTTARPPDQPVPLGVLAGRAPHRHLVRRTALHDWHTEAGAVFLGFGSLEDGPSRTAIRQPNTRWYARRGRPDRRVDSRQARVAGPRRGRVSRVRLPEPFREVEGRPGEIWSGL